MVCGEDAEKARGVVAVSSGNHAQGVAWAARRLGIAAAIVMPRNAPRVKLEATRALGAEIVLYDPDQDEYLEGAGGYPDFVVQQPTLRAQDALP